MVVDRLRIYSGFGACWGVLQLGLFRLIHPSLGPLLYLATAGYAVCAAFAFGMARRLPFGSSGVTGVGVGLASLEFVVHALSVQQTGEQMYFTIAALILIAAGVLLLHLRWTIAFVVIGISLMLGIGRPPLHDLTSDLLVLTAAGVTSIVLHLVGYRYVLDIELLRQRDQRHGAALEHALSDVRTQLADRERGEAERAAVEAEREELRGRLVRAQKLESLGTLAGGFAHDMNNVLGVILGGAELLREDAPASLHPEIDDLITATQRGAELTRNLLGFARRGHYRKELVDLQSFVGELIRMLQRTVPKGVVFESVFDEPCPLIEGDPSQLSQAVVNLCLNAVDAMRGVGTLRIAVTQVQLPHAGTNPHGVEPGSYAAIAVADTGCGIDPATQQRIFEPFFTTKGVGRGTGLGLAMVYGTVKAWGGIVEVDSTVGVGTTMTIYLPTSTTGMAARAPAPVRPADSASAGGTILVVDDDPQIRRVARRILENGGYRVHEACDGADALRVFDAQRASTQLVVLDMAMPVMGGAECFRELRARAPGLRILLASGYALEADARRCLSDGAIGFVDKPYTVDKFATAVAAAMRGEVVGTVEETAGTSGAQDDPDAKGP
jgi:signal transduction histidine kinase/CheY-like chemotaxis protein